jgi:hypothetical protein
MIFVETQAQQDAPIQDFEAIFLLKHFKELEIK